MRVEFVQSIDRFLKSLKKKADWTDFTLRKPLRDLSFSNKFCFYSFGIWWEYQSKNQWIFPRNTHSYTFSRRILRYMHCYWNLTKEEAFFRSNEVKDGFIFERTPKNRFVERGASSPTNIHFSWGSFLARIFDFFCLTICHNKQNPFELLLSKHSENRS